MEKLYLVNLINGASLVAKSYYECSPNEYRFVVMCSSGKTFDYEASKDMVDDIKVLEAEHFNLEELFKQLLERQKNKYEKDLL